MAADEPEGEASEHRAREAPVDELRQRLRSLGYLDAGVDRFVLAPVRGTRGATAIAFLASARIGLLGALLLGPPAALGIASALPGLVTSLRDRVVIGLYIAVLFGAAINVAAMVSGLLVAVAARRRGHAIAGHARSLSVLAGLLVGAASLIYLTLLWTAVQDAGAEAHSGWWTGAALWVAVGISLLLGHAVMLSALALAVSGTGAPAIVRGVPGASWRVMLAAGVVSFAGALVLSNAGGHGRNDAAPPPQLTVISSGARVRLFAIDGVDPVLFDSLSAGGRVPALTAAFHVAGARLGLHDADESDESRLDPARLWTTVATAQPASVHGVHTLETRRVAGVDGTLQGGEGSVIARAVRASTDLLRLTRPSVANGSQRLEKAFWEVAADAGLKTAVVNWWATWPTASDNAIVLSDRATLRLERGGALDGEISPPEVYERLRTAWPGLRDRAEAMATRSLAGTVADGIVAATLHRSAVIDALTLVLAGAVTDATTDLSVIYLPGLDIAQHALVGGGDSGIASPSAVAARLAALESYYVALDRLLAAALVPGTNELVMVITAPGRVEAKAGGRLGIAGSRVRGGEPIAARATDIAPTILYALGLPISDTIAGVPLVALFDAEFVRRYAVRHVPRYGVRAIRLVAHEGQPLDQEMVDRLRSLGYVR